MWFQVQTDLSERVTAYASIDITPLNFGTDSSFQNTAEYNASLFCALGMIQLGVASEPTLHRGDSKMALSWVEKGTAKSDASMNAGLAWAVCVMNTGIDVVRTSHLSTVENARADSLSRGGSWIETLRLDTLLFGGHLRSNTKRLHFDTDAIFRLCDPRRLLHTDEDFCQLFTDALALFPATSIQPRPRSTSVTRLHQQHPSWRLSRAWHTLLN